MKQHEIILTAMLENKDVKEWTAKDFQKGKYFVGYEASPRMSELATMYDNVINVGKQGRFRTLSINWENEEGVAELKEMLDIK